MLAPEKDANLLNLIFMVHLICWGADAAAYSQENCRLFCHPLGSGWIKVFYLLWQYIQSPHWPTWITRSSGNPLFQPFSLLPKASSNGSTWSKDFRPICSHWRLLMALLGDKYMATGYRDLQSSIHTDPFIYLELVLFFGNDARMKVQQKISQ